MLTIRVHDEFAKLRTAIVHDGSNAIDISLDDWRDFLPPEELARHPESGSSSKARLVEQHGRFRQVLADHRVNLLAPEPQEEAFDQVFARDPCFASGIEAVAVPHEALHLDCCLAPLPNGEALYAADKLPESSLTRLAKHFVRLIALDPNEAARHLAANLFWLDRHTVVSGLVTTTTNALLRAKGYEVIELDFSDLVTLWGGFRCVVCPIEREPPAERH